MGLFGNIKSLFVNKSMPDTEGNFYPLMNTSYGVNQLTRTDYLKLYTSWQYVAVSTIANTIADLDKSLTRTPNDDKQILHKHFNLITYELLVQIVSSLQLTGSCYLYKNMIGKTVDSLEFLRTDFITIDENADGSLKQYRYNAKNENLIFKKEDIIDISLFSPLKTFPYTVKGISPMSAVAIQAEMDSTANRWNWNFFKNGASAGDILSTTNPISPENKERLVSKWKSEFQGVNNSHKVAVLDNGLSYSKISLSQKELDFVETRRFTRDEVFAIFKIPKSIVGVVEDVNKANALTAERTYYTICIKPLAKMLQEVFNKELFYGIGYFQFVNIVPSDAEQLTADLNNGAITINEYRMERGWKPIIDGDFLKTNMLQIMPENNVELQDEETDLKKTIEKTIKKHITGTKENKEARFAEGQKKWEAKVQRTDRYEVKYIEKIQELFNEQKNDIVAQINGQKTKKINLPKMDSLLNTAKWVLGLSGIYKEVFQAEGNEALAHIGLNTMFQTGNPKANKWIRDNILLVAKEVDKTTKSKVFDVITQMNDEGKGAEEIAKAIDMTFNEFSKQRANAIARTEITRASTEAEIQAYEQSNVVSGKEWFTALDERTCDECSSMNGKVIGVRENYIDKGDTYRGVEYNYADINGPALHTNCRCTLLPVIQ